MAEIVIFYDKSKFRGDHNHYYEKIGNKVADITDEIPFEIPDSWGLVRLKHLSEMEAGGTPNRSVKEYWEKGHIPWLKISDLTNTDKVVLSATECITEAGLLNSPAKLVKSGAILYTIFATIGETRILGFDSSFNQAIAAINPHVPELRDYLFYFLMNLQTYMRTIGHGLAQQNINLTLLSNVVVALPPLAEQQRIVDKLEELEPYISEYERLVEENEQLDKGFPEKLKQSILQYAMQGKLVKQDPNDEPASVLLEKIKQEKEKLIKEGKVKKDKNESIIYRGDDKNYYEKIGNKVADITDEIPFEIPDSWCFTRLHNIAKIRNGFTPLRSVKEYWTNGEIPWFTIEDKNMQGPFINYTMQHISSKACTKDRIVPPNSILVCCTASIGEVAYTNINLTTNQQFNALTIYQSTTYYIEPMYLYYFCLTLKTVLIGLSTTTTFGFVSVDKLGHIILPIPTLKNQRTLIDKLKRVIDILDA